MSVTENANAFGGDDALMAECRRAGISLAGDGSVAVVMFDAPDSPRQRTEQRGRNDVFEVV